MSSLRLNERNYLVCTTTPHCAFLALCLIRKKSTLLLLLFITFVQIIYSCIPETNHVSMVYFCSYTIVTVYATCNVIYRDGSLVITTFFGMCALPTIVFCSALISRFPVMLLRYFMNDFVIFPVVIITCITFGFVHSISIVRS